MTGGVTGRFVGPKFYIVTGAHGQNLKTGVRGIQKKRNEHLITVQNMDNAIRDRFGTSSPEESLQNVENQDSTGIENDENRDPNLRFVSKISNIQRQLNNKNKVPKATNASIRELLVDHHNLVSKTVNKTMSTGFFIKRRVTSDGVNTVPFFI